MMIKQGQTVIFKYRPADWIWLERSNGPLGPYVSRRLLEKADGKAQGWLGEEWPCDIAAPVAALEAA